jgi:hypothetical protein
MQAGVESLHETMFACVGMVTEIEANADVFYATVRTHAKSHSKFSRSVSSRFLNVLDSGVAGAGASLQAGATSGTLGELARTIRQEVDGLEEAMRLARIVTRLQVGSRLSAHTAMSHLTGL